MPSMLAGRPWAGVTFVPGLDFSDWSRGFFSDLALWNRSPSFSFKTKAGRTEPRRSCRGLYFRLDAAPPSGGPAKPRRGFPACTVIGGPWLRNADVPRDRQPALTTVSGPEDIPGVPGTPCMPPRERSGLRRGRQHVVLAGKLTRLGPAGSVLSRQRSFRRRPALRVPPPPPAKTAPRESRRALPPHLGDDEKRRGPRPSRLCIATDGFQFKATCRESVYGGLSPSRVTRTGGTSIRPCNVR